MTASVSTRGMKGACFSDKERYDMYLLALSFYINEFFIRSKEGHPVKLVFADNSGWDLSQLKIDLCRQFDNDSVLKNVEFISISPDLFDITKGKGYNELLLINYTISRSKFIKSSRCFFKVTGRYPIYNLRRFINECQKEFESGNIFYCDIKHHSLYRILGLNWNSHSFEARLFGSTVDFYRNNIGDLYKYCNDYEGRYVENIIYSALCELTHNFNSTKALHNLSEGVKFRFLREPRFGGIEGSNSSAASFSKDQQSIKSKLKILVGNFFRIFVPWFKF